MRKKHILVVSQYFYPEQFRVNDICEQWVKDGYKVTVLTGIPNYPQGEFYEGYGLKSKRKETWNGIDIVRIPITPRKSGKIKLAMNYMSFVLSGLIWSLFTKVKADVVFIYEVSPMTQALPGVWYAKKKNIPCYLYVMDLWPENVESVLGIHNKYVLGGIGGLVDYIYKRCDKIFTSSQSFIEKIKKRGVEQDKLEFWPQYAEDFYIKYKEEFECEIPKDGILNLTFAGNIGYAQGLNVLVETAKRLKQKQEKVRFNIVGDGRFKHEFVNLVREYELEEYFNFIEKKPATDIPKYLSCSDAALITLSRSDVFAMTIPAKMQSCMACGIPIIGCLDGEAEKVINAAKCGFCGPSGDASRLEENIILFKNMSIDKKTEYADNALEYYKNNFDKTILMKKMEKYINK